MTHSVNGAAPDNSGDPPSSEGAGRRPGRGNWNLSPDVLPQRREAGFDTLPSVHANPPVIHIGYELTPSFLQVNRAVERPAPDARGPVAPLWHTVANGVAHLWHKSPGLDPPLWLLCRHEKSC